MGLLRFVGRHFGKLVALALAAAGAYFFFVREEAPEKIWEEIWKGPPPKTITLLNGKRQYYDMLHTEWVYYFEFIPSLDYLRLQGKQKPMVGPILRMPVNDHPSWFKALDRLPAMDVFNYSNATGQFYLFLNATAPTKNSAYILMMDPGEFLLETK